VTRQRLISALQYLIGLGLGVGLFYLVFRGVAWAQLAQRLALVNELWFALGLAAMVLAHVLRALRWQQLLAGAGVHAHWARAFAALMVGYTVNYAVPRAGEITRCTLLVRTDQVPLATAIGTVVTERLLDVLVLLLMLVALALLEADTVARLLAGWQNVDAGLVFGGLIAVAVLGVGGAVLLWRNRRRLPAQPLVQRIEHFLSTLVQGMLSIRSVPNPAAVVVQTVLIWSLYCLNTWMILRALPDFGSATLYLGFFLTALGAVGMALPVPGGIGSFHGLIVLGVVAKAYTESAGQEAALLLHTSSVILNVAIGLVALVWLVGQRPSVALPDEQR